MITLLNTIASEKGELFTIGHGRRVLLAHCKPEIRIYEKSIQIKSVGGTGSDIKSIRFTVALCEDMEFTQNNIADKLKDVERYELTADILRGDGIVERFYFHNISLILINTDNEWEFEMEITDEQLRKLSKIAGI